MTVNAPQQLLVINTKNSRPQLWGALFLAYTGKAGRTKPDNKTEYWNKQSRTPWLKYKLNNK